MTRWHLRHRRAWWVFDFGDRYARRKGLGGPHPRPVGRLRVELLGRTTERGVEEFRPTPLELVRNPSGYHLFFGFWHPRDIGRRRLDAVAGDYRLRVTSDLYQPLETAVRLPAAEAPYSFDLAPGHRYPFLRQSNALVTADAPLPPAPTLLRGGVHRPDGAGVAAARVIFASVEHARLQPGTEIEPFVTDRSGQWALELPLLPEGAERPARVTLNIELPTGEDLELPAIEVELGSETTLPQTARAAASPGPVREFQFSV